MLTIFRGDDLAFAEFNRKVCVRFNTIQDLTGWAAKFCLLDNVKQTNDISSRIWTFGYTSEETQQFPLGKTFGKLVILDSKGLVRQLAKVEVEIVNQKPEPCINGLIAISIDNVVADYTNMANKPVLNGKTIEGDHDSKYYGLADADQVERNTTAIVGLTNTVTAQGVTIADQGQAIAENYRKILAIEEEIGDFPDYEEEIAALSHRVDEEIEARQTADEQISTQAAEALERAINEEVAARNTAIEDAETREAERREEGDDELRAQIRQETEERELAVRSLTAGLTPIQQLLFVSENDPNTLVMLSVAMRNDGSGKLRPTVHLSVVPEEESDSDTSSSD